MAVSALDEIQDFLSCPTPDSWVEAAIKPENQDVLLIDHANCEKKAASTALNLIYRYIDNFELLNKMSRLAREEMRHFEQVIAIMAKRGIPYSNISASRYAAGLRQRVRTHEPAKLLDTLIVGAFIEARSCERFACLAPHLDPELQAFYRSLLQSEGRHYRDYLTLARRVGKAGEVENRIEAIRQCEQQLVISQDTEFRFHSGVPVGPVSMASVVNSLEPPV
ncbi:tRNA-(ms[2]io[6]A)-hydroxylase [Porticoccus sp.]|uniref:tRNA-(ms[2]io[6]A)-hydroxylase n=1 Tax=Porticoccus sp. TaxID=2024853 RepID=UPI003F6A10B8